MKYRKGFFRLSVVFSVLLFVFLLTYIIVLTPRNKDKDIDLVCYNEVLYCNDSSNGNTCLLNNQQFIQALKESDYAQLVSLLRSSIDQYKKYLMEQCNSGNKIICPNVFNVLDKLDCSYSDGDIIRIYTTNLKKQHEETMGLYLTVFIVYLVYLSLLFAIWWICLGFTNQVE